MDPRVWFTIEFIRKYWTELSMLYIDPDVMNIASYYDSKPTHSSGWWTCMYASPMVQSFFVSFDEMQKSQSTKISNVDEFQRVFAPGNTYTVEIMNHVFTLVYLDDQNVLYGDYFSETGRGRVSQYHGYNYDQGPNAFRLEVMSPDKILNYLSDYMNQDSEKEAEFHLGDQEFSRDRYDSYQYYNNNNMNLPLSYSMIPISKYLYSPGEVLESCWDTLYNTVNRNTLVKWFELYQPTKNMKECIRRVFTYALSEEQNPKPVELYVSKYMEVADNMIKVVGCMDQSVDTTLVIKGIENSRVTDYFDVWVDLLLATPGRTYQ